MAQLLYVHGVANREDDPQFQAGRVAPKKMFEEHAFRGNPLSFRDPYWGGSGAKPKFRFACIPKEKGTTLGIGAAIGAAAPAAPDVLLQAARGYFLAVVHTLSLELDPAVPAEARLAEAMVGYALSFEDGSATPAWVAAVADDDSFLSRLESESAAWIATDGTTTLGLGDTLRSIGRTIAGGASNLVNGPIAKGLRALTPQLGIFIGDVFTYLKAGARRQDIRNTVGADLRAAAVAARAGGEKLILVGHSLGGVILYDMLADPAWVSELEAAMGHPLEVDLFLTIGSQPGLFEEFDLFVASQPGQKGARPAPVARWWNVYDRVDVLSFKAEDVFDGVVDFEADTIAGVAGAHGAYLCSHLVHRRLNQRMEDAGLIQ